MNNKVTHVFAKSVICIAITSSFGVSTLSFAQDTPAEVQTKAQGIEVIAVTASRRKSSIQEAPMNITALDGDTMKDQNITELSDVARWVPGLTVPDQGGRTGSPIIVRGLNTNASGPDTDGGTVATYIGEIPLSVDMKILDVERVEVLIGPQGTLYGAGTLGGAIRYLPNKPVLDETSGSIYGQVSSLAQSDDTGSEGGFVFNTPIIDDEFGVRIAFNYLNDPGFIDYNYLVGEPGVSITDPNWSDADEVNSNIKRKKDVNDEQTTTARIMFRWTPNDDIDTTLSYFYQKQDIGGRSIAHGNSLSDDNPLSAIIGDYESAYRVEEPMTNETSLISLEISADLGFAELVSATGYSKSDSDGQRDQTDLLISLDYSYEEFPAFTAFTRDIDSKKVFTEELRLVSTSESDLSWVVGAFYNKQEKTNEGKEFTPGFGEYAVEYWGADQARPDNLEYIQQREEEIIEKAIFGEINYQATEQLSLTFGARFYDYKVTSAIGTDLPLLNTLFFGAGPDDIFIDLQSSTSSESGNIFKFNADYKFNDDVMLYATVSEGYRLGGSNGVPACLNDDDVYQNICGTPDEMSYNPDEITNYELGFKSTWLSNQFHFNAAVFMVDWADAQVGTFAETGGVDVTVNAASADARGLEISTRALITDQLTGFATYAYTSSELSADAPLLDDGLGNKALDGARLPGTPEHQFSLGLTYMTEITDDIGLDVNYGLTYQSDVYSQVGLLNMGEALPGYALSNMSAIFSKDSWKVTLYVDNMFDKYAYASVRRTAADITVNNDPSIQRYYGHYVVTPRKVGLRFEYLFDL